MWKVSWLYEKVYNIANFGGYTAILPPPLTGKQGTFIIMSSIMSLEVASLPDHVFPFLFQQRGKIW